MRVLVNPLIFTIEFKKIKSSHTINATPDAALSVRRMVDAEIPLSSKFLTVSLRIM
jgi:hypothetical protein